MKNILITGGSGLIGTALTKLLLENGYKVAWLSRSKKEIKNVKIFLWDVANNVLDDAAIEWADAIIHLAGEGIADKRWTDKRKKEIMESRTKSTSLLIEKLKLFPGKVQNIICASAIGYYGNRKNEILTENSKPGTGFLSESVIAWENATSAFEKLNLQLTRIRIGIVLSEKGGAFKELQKTAVIRILPVMGSGKQIYSWIHIDDVCGIILFVLKNNLSGIYNAVAPNPVSQKQLMEKIKSVSGKFYVLVPVPVFGLEIILGEMKNMLLINQQVIGEKIIKAGYKFKFVEVDVAIKGLMDKSG